MYFTRCTYNQRVVHWFHYKSCLYQPRISHNYVIKFSRMVYFNTIFNRGRVYEEKEMSQYIKPPDYNVGVQFSWLHFLNLPNIHTGSTKVLLSNVMLTQLCYWHLTKRSVRSHFINLYLTMAFQSTLHILVVAMSDKPRTRFQLSETTFVKMVYAFSEPVY